MMKERRSAARVRLGIAIGTEAMVVTAEPAVLPGGTLTMALAGAPSADGEWPALEAAFAELRTRFPARASVSASVAIMLPLAQVRRIELPPLSAIERRLVLGRDASRWFVGAREPFVADALPVAGTKSEVIAAALPARYADAVSRAAKGAGIQLRTMQAAPWAWAASVERTRRASTRAVVASDECALNLIWLSAGAVTGIRRLRNGEDADARADALLHDGGDAGAVHRIADAMAVAARFADRARGPELLPESAHLAHRNAVARHARALLMAAAAVFVLAAGLELWGAKRQLAQVRAERETLRARVTGAMASRDSAVALEAQLGAVATEVREAPRWTAVIAALTARLPNDAWLQSLTASGDSVSLVGESVHAAEVFETLRRDPAIAGVRADAPIRRESSADRAPVERYGLTVRLAPAAMAEPVLAPKEAP